MKFNVQNIKSVFTHVYSKCFLTENRGGISQLTPLEEAPRTGRGSGGGQGEENGVTVSSAVWLNENLPHYCGRFHGIVCVEN